MHLGAFAYLCCTQHHKYVYRHILTHIWQWHLLHFITNSVCFVRLRVFLPSKIEIGLRQFSLFLCYTSCPHCTAAWLNVGTMLGLPSNSVFNHHGGTSEVLFPELPLTICHPHLPPHHHHHHQEEFHHVDPGTSLAWHTLHDRTAGTVASLLKKREGPVCMRPNSDTIFIWYIWNYTLHRC